VLCGWVWPGLWWLEWFFLFFTVFVRVGGCVSAFCGLFATFLEKVG
jgi:flagellar biosynthesis protein FliR